MKFHQVTFMAILMILLAAGGVSGASDPAVIENPADPVPSVVPAAGTPHMIVSEISYKFDPVVDGTLITHDFTIKNTGSETLVVERVKTG